MKAKRGRKEYSLRDSWKLFWPFLNVYVGYNIQFSRSVVSDSWQPHGPQHARLPCPSPTPGAYSNSYPSSWWCHSLFLKQFTYSCPKNNHISCLHAQSWLTFWDPMHCSPPGSSVNGILQARILEWVAIPFSRGSSQPRDRTWVSRITSVFFFFLPFEPPGKPYSEYGSHQK